MIKAGSGTDSTQNQTHKGATLGKGTVSSGGGESSQNEETKSSIQQPPLKEQLSAIREVVSDTDEESHGRMSLDRKVDMLGVRDVKEVYEIQTNSNRKKSQDFSRESLKI